MAHIILKQELKTVETVGGMTFFTCDPDGEHEPNWPAGCLLVPRRVLYPAARRGPDALARTETYRVSEPMASFRLRTTGVTRQLEAARAGRTTS